MALNVVHLDRFPNVRLYEVLCNFQALARGELHFCTGNIVLHRRIIWLHKSF